MQDKPVIRVENLTKYYGKFQGIENISFSVQRGEIFGFLGPNGAGKTTTIRLLLDLIKPTGGQIFLFGKTLPGNSQQIRKRCSYLPGDFRAYLKFTAMEYFNYLNAMRESQPVLQDKLIDRLKLAQRELSQKIKNCSHGALQKLGIVQALSHKPELAILDEPSLGLDPLMQEELYDILRELHNEGTTIFFSSHNLPEVQKICQRLGIVRAGKLVALETIEALKEKSYRKIILTLKTAVDNPGLPKSKLVSHNGLRYEYIYNGDMKNLLSHLNRLPVADIAIPEPDLEEIFLAYYRDSNNE